jgi:NitT/TauT family transport system ATP-binding protein
LIELHNVSRSFRSRDGDEVLALRDLSLSIGRNEFVTLVGPSGCGKSTLLRLVAGLILPSRGVAKIDGTPVLGPRDETAIVFQSPTLLPWASVLDNVLFPLRMMGRMAPESRPGHA